MCHLYVSAGPAGNNLKEPLQDGFLQAVRQVGLEEAVVNRRPRSEKVAAALRGMRGLPRLVRQHKSLVKTISLGKDKSWQ